MLKVTNTSNKVVGFRGEDGENVSILPDESVMVENDMKTVVKTLEDCGLAKIEETDTDSVEEAAESVVETAESTEEVKKPRGRKPKEVL